MAITLTDLLDEKQVILGLRSRKAPNALREITDLLAQNGKIDNPEAFFEKVLAREQAHPSVVENRVAFPHARTDLVDEIVVGIGRSRAGIPFGHNGVRARLIFVIGVPARPSPTRIYRRAHGDIVAPFLPATRSCAKAVETRAL